MIMFTYATPEECGISSSVIEKYIRRLDENGYAMHSIMMSRSDKIFAEGYWKPFDDQSLQRMNSITKSFVGIAIGLLEEEGRLSLEDKVSDYFKDSFPADCPDFTKELTIGDLLAMRTVNGEPVGHWVRDGVNDRILPFFSEKAVKPKDTLFRYDSTGCFILCVIAEKITGMPFVEYLKDKILRDIGFCEETSCIKGPDGYSWGDSGLLCRTKDLLSFTKFVMDKGISDGKRLMNKEFLTRATSKISDTNTKGFLAHNTFGYGYQIWKTYEDGFAFFGMGDQLAVCVPKKDFIFICTADNQGNPASRPVIMNLLYHDIIKELSDTPLPPNPDACDSLRSYCKSLELVSLLGDATSPAVKIVNNAQYVLGSNPMKIEKFSLAFDTSHNSGVLKYKNKQGEKELYFNMCNNNYTFFPQEGYPDTQMNVPCPGNKYPCAVSAAWLEERKLGIRVQMTGKHLGGLYISIGFSPDYNDVCMHMVKNTNCFLNEYSGYAAGHKI